MIGLLIVALCGPAGVGVVGAEPQPRDESIVAMVAVADPEMLAVSPDGRWVAYQRTDPARIVTPAEGVPVRGYERSGLPHRFAATEIRVVDTTTAQERVLPGKSGGNLEPRWSPDGQRLAFISDRGGMPQIWVWTQRDNTVNRLSDAVISVDSNFASTLRWSWDGRSIFARLCAEGEAIDDCNLRQATRGMSIVRSGIGGTSVSRRVLVSGPALSNPPWLSGAADLGRISFPAGNVSRLITAQPFQWFAPSPDGTHIAVMSTEDSASKYPRTTRFGLSVLDIATGVVLALARTGGYPPYTWSPDGQYLAYADNTVEHSRRGESGKTRLHVVDVATASVKPVNVADEITPSVDDQDLGWPKALWNENSSATYFIAGGALWRVRWPRGATDLVKRLPDDEQIDAIVPDSSGERIGRLGAAASVVLISHNRRFEQSLKLLNMNTGQVVTVVQPEAVHLDQRVAAAVAGRGAHRASFMMANAREGDQLWSFDSGAGGLRQISRFNPALAALPRRPRIRVGWSGAGGQSSGGYLILPPDYSPGKSCPLILNLYAGETVAQRINSTELDDPVDRIFPLHGYAVLHADTVLRVGSPMSDVKAAIIPAVEKVTEMGFGTAGRLGVFGHSYGGYSVLSLLVQTTLFKAAVASAPMADLVSFYGQLAGTSGIPRGIDWAEEAQGRLGISLWQDRKRYTENSPVFFLDRIHTPVLLLHGMDDSNVSVAQSAEVYSGMVRLGREVEYTQFAGEDHLVEYWGFANRVDYYQRVLLWFDRYLRTEPHRRSTSPGSGSQGRSPSQ